MDKTCVTEVTHKHNIWSEPEVKVCYDAKYGKGLSVIADNAGKSGDYIVQSLLTLACSTCQELSLNKLLNSYGVCWQL